MLQLFSILDIKPPYIIYMECILQCIYYFETPFDVISMFSFMANVFFSCVIDAKTLNQN